MVLAMEKNEIEVKCDKCQENRASSTHLFLKESHLCSNCAQTEKDDQMPGEREKQLLDEAIKDLNEINDLCLCLFVYLSNPETEKLPRSPPISLVNTIGDQLSYVSINLNDLKELND